ncbi:MAG: hypothetical protein IPI27_18415 [Betaproteobacteria bacterium]|nr:hypothetical protein [Betaproteobacteria bacterium]
MNTEERWKKASRLWTGIAQPAWRWSRDGPLQRHWPLPVDLRPSCGRCWPTATYPRGRLWMRPSARVARRSSSGAFSGERRHALEVRFAELKLAQENRPQSADRARSRRRAAAEKEQEITVLF